MASLFTSVRLRVSPIIGARLACTLLSSVGCLSQSYELSADELERIVQLPAEERGEHLRVTQQTSLSSDTGLIEQGPPWPHAGGIWIVDGEGGHHHRGRRHHSHDSDDDDYDTADDEAADALAAAVVVVAAAATVAVSVGITEGARFDGWVQAPSDHPVLLVDDSGRHRWERLDRLTADDVHRIDRAVLPDGGGALARLARHPLDRAGFVYQLEFGAEPAPFEGPTLALAARGGIGFMPDQRYGFLLGAAFSTASGDDAVEASPTLSIDYRTFLQVETWPLRMGRWHVGAYGELGYGWALADDRLSSHAADGPMVALGCALQLDWTTRLALTLRAGAAWLPTIDTGIDRTSSAYRLSPALTLGLSIY
jgi:hypothetical protein